MAQNKALKRVDMIAFLLRCASKDWLKKNNLTFKDLEEQRNLTGLINVGTRRKERRRITALYLSFIRTYGDQAEGVPTLRVIRHLDGEEVPEKTTVEGDVSDEMKEEEGGDENDEDGASAE